MNEHKSCNKCKSKKIYIYSSEATEMDNKGVWSYTYWCKECWVKEFEARCEKKLQETSEIDKNNKHSLLMQYKSILESNGYLVTKNDMNEHYETAKWPVIVWILLIAGILIFLAGAVAIVTHLDIISTCNQLAIK